jgi:hypothetical protein
MKSAIAALIFLLAIPAFADGPKQCPLIRPAGLVKDEVDGIVIERLSAWLHLSSGSLDHSKSIAQPAGSDSNAAWLTMTFGSLEIGQALGFNANEAFLNLAKQKGTKPPEESLSVGEMLAISEKAYFAGSDSPPPHVTPGEKFSNGTLIVSVPKIPVDWMMPRCGSDEIAFVFREANGDVIAAATRSYIKIGAYKGDDQFLAQIRAAASSMPTSSSLSSTMRVAVIEGAKPPCGRLEISTAVEGSPYSIFANFCHWDETGDTGYSIMFSRKGASLDTSTRKDAEDFVSGISRARGKSK